MTNLVERVVGVLPHHPYMKLPTGEYVDFDDNGAHDLIEAAREYRDEQLQNKITATAASQDRKDTAAAARARHNYAWSTLLESLKHRYVFCTARGESRYYISEEDWVDNIVALSEQLDTVLDPPSAVD